MLLLYPNKNINKNIQKQKVIKGINIQIYSSHFPLSTLYFKKCVYACFFLFGTGDWTQFLVHAKHLLYHQVMPSASKIILMSDKQYFINNYLRNNYILPQKKIIMKLFRVSKDSNMKLANYKNNNKKRYWINIKT